MSVVASRYSEALFELAIEESCLETMFDNYKIVIDIFREHPDLIEVLSHPEIDLKDKVNLVKDSFSNINAQLISFMCILIEKDRLREIYNVFEDFEVLYNIHFNISVASVYSVNKLSEEQLQTLNSKLSKKLNKEIKIKNIVDKSLIGGMKIMIDNHVMDYSLKSKIDSLSEDLHKIQIK